MHRHVQLVAIRILELQELAAHAAGFERRQAEVAADTVLGMHDRRAGLEIVELTNDGFGIALDASLPVAAACALTEQLLLADNRHAARRQQHAVLDRCDGDPDAVLRAAKRLPVGDPRQIEVAAGQQVKYLFTPPGRIAAEQHAAVEVRRGSASGRPQHRRSAPRRAARAAAASRDC